MSGAGEAEFRALFERLGPDLHRWARRAVGPDAADDVVAETFTVAWRRWSTMPTDPEHRRAWLFVVARHKAAHVRAGLTRDSRLLSRLGREPAERPQLDVADVVEASELGLDVLRRLSPEDRELILLVGVGHLSTADAADVLGCTVTALTTRLHRARARLERAMGELTENREAGVCRA